MTTKLILTLALLFSIIIPFGSYFIGEKRKGKFKNILLVNIISFFTVLILSTVFLFSGNVYAAEATATAGAVTGAAAGMAYLAAALVTGLSTVGAGIAVASAASAALGAISEDEGIMGKALIFVALAEGIALYGLLVSFTILGKV